MLYTEWLKSIGCESGLTESRARAMAKPPEEPPSDQMAEVSGAVVHHSATETGNAACFRVLHRGINGWNDIGYHFVIGNGSLSGDGEVEQGREMPLAGAHAKGANHHTIGICLVGNFNLSPPSPLQMRSLGRLLSSLMKKYRFQAEAVTLHRLVKGSMTQCPGKLLEIDDVRKLIIF